MSTDSIHLPAAVKYEVKVRDQGRIELTVPYPAGERVVVVVTPESADATDDLVAAAQSSLDFWDNPYDDRDWNKATI